MEIVGLAAVSIVVGLLVGVLSGMLGIGGGTVLVPIFKLGYAMDAIASTATSLFTIIPTSISGMITHIRNRTCIPSLGIAAGIGGAITAPIGVWLASISPDWSIMVAAALVIAYSATTMFQKAIKSLKRDRQKVKADSGKGADKRAVEVAGKATVENTIENAIEDTDNGVAEGMRRASEAQTAAEIVVQTTIDAPEKATATTIKASAKADSATDDTAILTALKTKRNMVICGIIGLVAGIMSGYVGVGGGFIMVPLFMQLLNLPMRLTSGTSLISILILATSGTILQIIYGNIDWVAGIFIAVGSIPGAYIGSRLIIKVPETALRFMFSGFLIIAAILLVLNQMNIF